VALDLKKTVAVLSGVVTVQEAEPLLEWLHATPKGKLNLAACEHVHAAALQVILRTGATIQKDPTDPDLVSWLRGAGA